MKYIKISPIYKRIRSILFGNSLNNSLSCSTGCCDEESVTNSQRNPAISSLSEVKIIESLEDKSVVCTLTDSKLAERKNKLIKDVFSKVSNKIEIETGYIFTFPYDERLLMIMTEYIIAEKSCCPFFDFEIKLLQSNVMHLKITGPKAAKKMIQMFLSEI